MQITNVTLPLVLALSALLTGACKDSSTSGGSGSAAAPAGGASEDLKLNAAIKCQNRVSASFHRSRTMYLRSVDPDVGPTPESKNLSVGEVDVSGCTEPLAEAIAAKPALADLDGAMAAYRTAIEAAAPVINEASTYYEQERHRDDDLAKGKELHPKLMESYKAFSEADRALGAIVNVRNRARKEAELATYAKDPKQRDKYLRGKVLLVAEELVEIGLAPSIEEIDITVFNAKLEDLDKQVAELAKHADESGSTTLEDSANDFLKAALGISRRIREKTPYTAFEARNIERGMGQNVEGSIPNLLKAYNDMIDDANRNLNR